MGRSYVHEGIEAAGKSLRTRLLTGIFQYINEFPVIPVREPGGTEVGREIREILLGKHGPSLLPRARLHLYTADRVQIIYDRVTPFLTEHPDGITIGDRSWPSTLALQTTDGEDYQYAMNSQKEFIDVYPTKIFLLDLHEEEAGVRMFAHQVHERRGDRETNWRDEMPIEDYARHRKNYLNLAKMFPDKFVLLDGFMTPWETAYFEMMYILNDLTRDKETESRALRVMERYGGGGFQEIIGSFLDPNRTDGIFDEGKLLMETEDARKILGAPSKESLRGRMREEWKQLGLEGSSSGIERGK